MKYLLLCSAIVLSSVLAAVASVEDLETAWTDFTAKFGHKIGPAKSAPAKKAKFAEAHLILEKHNRDPRSTFFMKHNEFSVMTEMEKKLHLMDEKLVLDLVIPEEPSMPRPPQQHGNNKRFRRDIPALVDYRTSVCLGSVKDQGQCGSCWAFAAVASLEYYNCIRNGNKYVSLSEQQLVDCDASNNGCNGGNSEKAWNHLLTAGGSGKTASYPYTATKGTSCLFNSNTVGAKVASFGYSGNNAAAIQQALVSYGPVVIYFYVADSFFRYGGGVYNDPTCNDRGVNHVMNIVGYGTDAATGMDYWIVRNSWGPGWGQGGYILIQRGVNMCSIETYPRYVKSWELASSPASASGGVVRFDSDCSFFSDFGSGTSSKSQEACWTDCLNNDNCTHFYWYPNACYLKTIRTERAPITRMNGGICGFVAGRSKQLEPTGTAQLSRAWLQSKGGLIRFDTGCTFSGPGSLMSSQTSVASINKEDCFNLCLSTTNCSHFTYDDINKSCELRFIPDGVTATDGNGSTTCGYVAGRSNQPTP